MTALAISVSELTRDFRTVRALDAVSFDVPAGIVFGFLGPNGAGKTTLIRILLGIAHASSGRAQVMGLDPARHGARVREQSGALLEHNGLYERLTARQNLQFHARAFRMTPAMTTTRIQELLTRFGLWERRNEVVGTWSRGMKQRLAVARAVLHRPPVVFLDEPTAGLDPVASASLRDELARLATDEGVTVFLTTHNLAEAERLCAMVGVIRKGRLLACGSPAALRESNGGPVVRVGMQAGTMDAESVAGSLRQLPFVTEVPQMEPDALRVALRRREDIPELVRWLVAQGIDLTEVTPERATFERTFLDLVDTGGGATS